MGGGGAAAASPHGVGGDAHADGRADGAGHDEPARMTERPCQRVSAGRLRQASSVPSRASKRGARWGPPREREAPAARSTRGRIARVPRRLAAATRGPGPSRASSTARSSRSAAEGLMGHHAPANTAEPKRYTARADQRSTPPSSVAASSRRARCWSTRTAPWLRSSTSPISRVESPSTKRSTPPGDDRRQRRTAARRRRVSSARPTRLRRVVVRREARRPVERGRSVPAAAAQRVRELVVRDAEQPRAERGPVSRKRPMAAIAARNVRSVTSSASWWSPSR